ncbi:MAG: MMPL family transporter [Chitinivibrionales bacterium]|nr:MMPL family transporter [Chitinivibrionales bacterium]
MSRPLGIVTFSVEKRVTITMLILIVVVFGLLALSKLGLDMLPDIKYPMVTVVIQYGGVAPEEIEQLITVPLEGVIAGVNKVKRIGSKSSEGISTIMVEFEWGTDLDFAAQDIKDNIEFVKDFLPDDITEPLLFKFNVSQFPIMILGVTGNADTYLLLRLLNDNVVERLQRLDGVANAAAVGEKKREIHIALDPVRLKHKGLGISGVMQALQMQNMNTPAGYFVRSNTDFLLRAIGEFQSLDEIGDAIIGAAPNGDPVYLREVASVLDTYKEARNKIRMDGNESVFLMVNKRSGANTLRVCQRVNAELREIMRLYPELIFHEVFDQGEPVKKFTGATSMNALAGGLLAIAFMFVFLINIRPTIAIAVAIPLSIITTFIALYLAGYTLNLMTLGGLALGVGMLIDNAIVVIENIYRHLELKIDRREAAKRGASEVAAAITASTFTTVVVFLPILFSEGMASQLFRGVGLTIIFSLLASLFVALTIVPMLASVLFKEQRMQERQSWFDAVRNWYVGRLQVALARPRVTLMISALIFGGSIALGWLNLGREFLPALDGNRFVVKVELPVGTTLEETAALTGQIRELLKTMPEVVTVAEVIGRSETQRGGEQAEITGPHAAQLYIKLVEAKKRELAEMQVQDQVRKRLPALADTKITFMSMGVMNDGSKPVQVYVQGKDLETLEEICRKVAGIAATVAGVKDVESSFDTGRPEYHFTINRRKAVSYGLMPAHIQAALETANLGTIVTRYRTGEDEIDVRIILDKQFRTSLDALRNLPLSSATGAIIPLAQVVEITRTSGPTLINRNNKFRVGTVDANIHERALGKVIADFKLALEPLEKSLPRGYSLRFGGAFEDMQETFRQLLLGLLLALLLVYMVMAAQFESLLQPFIIMATVPLSLIGVSLLLTITGKTFSVVAFIGVIILAGIVVNNGIVLVDYVNQLRRGGMSCVDALLKSGATRVRPILITAGTTIMGMMPMALSRSEGSELRAPMSLTVIGGLISATFLTLFVVPVVYKLIDGLSERIKVKAKRVIG